MQVAPPLTIPVTATSAGGAFSGAFTLTSFAVRDGHVAAQGTLNGVVTKPAGGTRAVLTAVALPVEVANTTSEFLRLDLEPISLDLLGLQVDLRGLVIDVTTDAGAGNGLGHLFCGVSGLLDNPGGLARLLNEVLEAL